MFTRHRRTKTTLLSQSLRLTLAFTVLTGVGYPLFVTGVAQLAFHLLANAAAYSPSDKAIRLSAQLDAQTLVLRVADQGIGLAPGEEKKVFEKFYRGPKARPGGTGLGLSIVQGFVHAHKGTIAAENNPDGGATFTLRIPVETETPTHEDQPHHPGH